MRRKAVLLYGIGLTVILHLLVLALLHYDNGGEEEVAPWSVRNAGAQRNIHLMQEGEVVVKARSLSHGSPVEPKAVSPTVDNLSTPHPTAKVSLSSNLGSIRTAFSTFGTPSAEVRSKLPLTELANTAVSKERWERLKAPSMLLNSKDERAKMKLYADTHQRNNWLKERRQQNALAELEERQKVPRKGSQQELASRKSDKPKKPNDWRVKEDILAEERKRAESLNEKWKERRKHLENGKKFDGGDYAAVDGGLGDSPKVPTLDQYFQEVCAEPPGPLVECSNTPLRKLSEREEAGDDIMLSIRTTMKYHNTRLPVLFDTWLGEVEPTNVFIVTDGEDEDLLWKTNTLG